MAETPRLVVRSPGHPEQSVAVGARPLVVGRGEDCEVWIPEKKASRRHARVVSLEGGGHVVEDLNSANGTFLGERRVLRIALEDGATFRIGDTTLTLETGAAPTVGGTIALKSVDAVPPPATVPPAGMPPAGMPPTGVPRVDMRVLGRAIAFAMAAAAILAGVEFLLGSRAGEERGRAEARADLRAVLQRMDVSSLDQVEADVLQFKVKHPEARGEAERLDRWLAFARGREDRRVRIESRFNTLVGGQASIPESDVRAGLLALRREIATDADLQSRIDLALAALDRKRADAATEEVEDAARRSGLLLADRRPGPALRLLHALRAQWPTLPSAARESIVAAEERAIEAAKALEQDATAAAEREADPDRRRGLLAAAWEGLEGTPQGERLAEVLRFARPGSRAADAPAPAGGTAPPAAPLPTDVLARGAEAEKWFLTRRWGEARAQFLELMRHVPTGLLHDEWNGRVAEIDRLLSLVSDLDRAAKSGTPVRRRLAEGPVTVTAAAADGVTLQQKEKAVSRPWGEVLEQDVVPLLTPDKPTPEQRLAVATLAATVNDRAALLRTLLPLYEKGEVKDQADRLVARYLYGRLAPPEGGYRVYQGELLDASGYFRRVEAERLAGLRATAEEILAKVSKDPAFHKLEKLRELRAELDKRRHYALMAIFDETHYPYPYDRGSQPYQVVQREVDRRVDRVRETWGAETKARVARTETLKKSLEEWGKTINDLRLAKQDVTALEAKMAPYASYATGESFTVRTFFLNESEKDLFEYNRWVMDVYNPGRTAVATEAERKQTQITNEYRVMMGFSLGVNPGPAPYPSVTKENVVGVLDAGSEASPLVPLRALRIDDRLVRAARLHSQDMTARNYFDHFAPENPATGEGRLSPFDRMKKQGYEGAAASENIAGAGDPMTAHAMWCHSSGHHRNIVSPWVDQGVGFAGHAWTQNFGAGGGEPPAMPGRDVPITPSEPSDEPLDVPSDAPRDAPPDEPGQDPGEGR